ncbi:MAG: DNA-binding response regulator [Bacteroidetes bacterium RIFCSPLOWO2_12_FULL_35_15]|nr:MAG: DNA-binding response regulator [Bacteroidetes bacterium RIFCSPLOWO2_12_FULL_35_15]
MKILIIEDEKDLLDSMKMYLESEGYLCETANDYQKASEKVNMYQYDCVVVDITLPKGNGLQIIKELKEKKSEAGIIIVSAKNSLDDKLKGLELGSDDYLTKPFHLSELNARIKAIIRRKNFEGANELSLNEITIDLASRTVFIKKNQLTLTTKEYELLLFFISNKNKVITKNAIAEHLWGDDMDQSDSFDFIYTHIKNLRKKLIEKGCQDYIKTIYGIGYNFSTQEQS